MVIRYHLLFITFLISLLFIPGSLFAQEISFYSDVSPRAGSTDDTFILSVVIENSTRPGTPFLTGGEDFDIRLLGPRQSTTIVNGTVSTEIAYNYQLTPKKDGLLSSPAAEVEIDGKKYTSPPIQVKVTKSDINNRNINNSNIILQQSIANPKVFIGEQVHYSLSLYAAVPIYDYNLSDEPMDGFWAQNMGDVDKSQATLNNQRYNLFRWNKALYPVKSGTLSISPKKLTAQIQVRSRSRSFPFGNDPFSDPFDNLFGATNIEKREYLSNAVNVEVTPLPSKPKDFSNWGLSSVLVGKTKIDIQADSSPMNTGENKTITVIIESLGNLNPYNKLPLSESNDYRIYQDNSIDKSTISDGLLKMTKTIKVSIVPLKPGKFTLPPITLGYFNPETSTYEHATSQSVEFNVSGKDLRQNEALQIDRQLAEEIQREISNPAVQPPKYIEDSFLKKLSTQISTSLALFITALLIFFAYIITLLFKYRAGNSSKTSVLKKIEKAGDLAALSVLIQELLSEKLSLPPESLSGDSLRMSLNKKITDQELRFRLQNVIDRIDSVQYGGTTNTLLDITEIQSELKYIFTQL